MLTGAARGIGKACAQTFARHGAGFILIVDMDLINAEDTAKSISEEYCTLCKAVKADVSNENDVKKRI